MEKRMMSVRCGILCAAVIAATGSAGLAQYQRSNGGVQQVQPQGNALDASPQVGSGGSNNPVTGYVPMNANNYVQGNVSGLGGFNQQQSVVNVNGVNVPVNNWNTGTQSPYTFRGDSGQNSSFSNWIRTSSGGLQTTPASAANSFYLPSSMVSTAQGNIYSSPYGSGFQNSLVPSSAINPAAGGAGMATGGVSIRDFAATPTNQYGSNNGGLGSPLFAERNGNPAGNALGVDPGYNSMNQNNPSANPNLVDPAAVRSGLNTGPINGTGNALGDTDEERRAREKLANPADLSSMAQVDGRVNGQTGNRLEGQPDSVQNANVLPQGQMIAERSKVNDTYKTLMGELEKAEAAAKQKEALAKATPNQSGKTGKGDKTAKGDKAGETSEQPASAPVSSQPNGNGMVGVNGTNGKNASNPFMGGMQSTDPTKPGYRPESMRPLRIDERSTEDLQAGKNVPAIKTFGSEGHATATPFDELMSKAEGLLKDGKYLDAANAYQTAMLSQPDNLLVYMGRANAELGAGMYQSAAGDLKFVFTRKPEMISVKYALEDYIPPQRQHQLLSDLTGLSQGKGVGNTASFLLCYMDYNTERDVELQRELGRWGARPWKDTWYDVMNRALGNGGGNGGE